MEGKKGRRNIGDQCNKLKKERIPTKKKSGIR